MQIGRILGPLYQGITLDRDSGNDRYFPTYHFGNLYLDDDPTSMMAFRQRLTSGRGTVGGGVTVQQHDDNFTDIVNRFLDEAIFPTIGDISTRDFEICFGLYKLSSHFHMTSLHIYLDLYLVYVYAGDWNRANNIKGAINTYICKLCHKDQVSLTKIYWFQRYEMLSSGTVDLKTLIEGEVRRLKLTGLMCRDVTLIPSEFP